jgi:hypothetical protein
MPTLEQPLEDIHAEIYAATGGFIFGVNVFGDTFGGEALRFGAVYFGDEFSDAYETEQWVDYTPNTTNIVYSRGAVNDGASNTVQVGLMSLSLKDAGNPLTDFKVRSGRKIRLRNNDEILFSGTINAVPGRYVRRKNTYTKYFTVQAADAVKRLAGQKAYGAGGLSEPYESFEERIARLLDTYPGPVDFPTGDAYPDFRLSATVYEASLAAHLDLACNSVGASWYIDKLGQIRFNTTLTDYITAVFSDGTHTETLENYFPYYGIDISYDPRNHINYLELANKGIIEDPANPGEALAAETTTIFADAYSVASNDYLKDDLQTCLYNEGAYEGSLEARANAILLAYSEPKPTISTVRFNVQENFSAANLETLHLVELWHEGVKHTQRVVGIHATINPTEWLIELELVKEI